MNRFKSYYKIIKKILPILFLAVVVWMGMGGVAHAQGAIASAAGWLFDKVLFNPVLQLVAYLAHILFSLSSMFLAMCGTLMNVGIQLTVHLGTFIHNNDIIYTVWGTIRDIASILLIFFILWAALQMILSLKSAGYATLIKNIVIAGILINFSFFLAQVLIDASNIVSLQFYNAMAPSQDVEYLPDDTLGQVISKTITNGSGGVSGIFSSALGVNQWWSNKSNFQSSVSTAGGDTNLLMGIIISNVAGTLVQILAGLSFLAAALATLWRSVILILLLGFSPIWIAAYAMPQLKDFKDQWMGPFKSNLLFLPTYLMFMYVAVLIISKSDLNFLVSNLSTNSGNTSGVYIQLFVAFAIIIILVNVPLIAALKFSSLNLKVVKSLGDSMESFRKWATTGRLKATSGWTGRNVVGQGAYALNKSDTLRGLARWSPAAGILASKGLSKVSSASFGGKKDGYDTSLKRQKKDIEAMHRRIGEVERSDYGSIGEFKEAEKKAREDQAGFRTSLIRPNLFNRMMGIRGNREAEAKLSEDARKKALLNSLKVDKKAREDKTQELKELNKRLENDARGVGFAPGKTPSAEDLERRRKLEEEVGRLDEQIEKAEEEKEKESIEQIVKGVREKNDEEKGGKSEKKKEENESNKT